MVNVNVTLVSGSDSKDLLSGKYYWTKVRMACCQVMKSTQWISTPKKLTMIAVSKTTSIYTIVWYRAMKFITRLRYVCMNAFRSLWIYFEKIALVHRSVVVYNHTSPFFLCLKECVIISEFGSTVSCGLIRDKAYKAQSYFLTYTFTGQHEMYNPWKWSFCPMIS